MHGKQCKQGVMQCIGLALTTILLVSCGGGSDSTTTTTSPTVGTESTQPTEPAPTSGTDFVEGSVLFDETTINQVLRTEQVGDQLKVIASASNATTGSNKIGKLMSVTLWDSRGK